MRDRRSLRPWRAILTPLVGGRDRPHAAEGSEIGAAVAFCDVGVFRKTWGRMVTVTHT